MFRPLAVLIVVIGLATSADAEPIWLQNPGDPTIAEARNLIYAKDIAGLERFFGDAHARYLSNELHADDIRRVFAVFSTTNPRMIRLTREWVEDHPNSAFAHAARGWAAAAAGDIIRGTRSARKTYSEALRQHSILHREAWEHAISANDTLPDFIPTSDLLLRLAPTKGDRQVAFASLDQLMRENPNWGTLARSLFLSHKGWGGSPFIANGICAKYAPMLTWVEDIDPRILCLVHAAYWYQNEKRDWLNKTLWEEESPRLDTYRITKAISIYAPREQAEWARDYLSENPSYLKSELAEKYDREVAARFGFPLISEARLREEQAWAREALKHDPYNAYIISVLEMYVYRLEVELTATGHRTRGTVMSRPTDEERLDYARRLVISSPFNAKYWLDLADEVTSPGAGWLLADDYRVNAIVYSNHSPENLLIFMDKKLRELDLHQKIPVTEGYSQVWKDWAATTNAETEILCPLLRAHRLYRAICDLGERQSGCTLESPGEETYAMLASQARADGQCLTILNKPVDQLAFEPITFDLSRADD